MKKIILATAIALLTTMPASAQYNNNSTAKPVQNISVELLGPSNWLGLQYDTRVKGNSGWGYSVGLGWGYSEASTLFKIVEKYHLISLVPRANYLIGNKSSKLELGFGTNIGYLTGKTEYDRYTIKEKDNKTYYEYTEHVIEKKNSFTYYFFGNIGYRLQQANGFTLRVGLSPSFGLGGTHTVDDFYLIPYLSFGKSF